MKALSVIIALAVSGCSFGMKTVPSTWSPEQQPVCSGPALPLVDTGVALSGFVLAGLTYAALPLEWCDSAEDSSCGRSPTAKEAMPAIGMAVGSAVFAAAAMYGASKASRCREARHAHRDFLTPPQESMAQLDGRLVPQRLPQPFLSPEETALCRAKIRDHRALIDPVAKAHSFMALPDHCKPLLSDTEGAPGSR